MDTDTWVYLSDSGVIRFTQVVDGVIYEDDIYIEDDTAKTSTDWELF